MRIRLGRALALTLALSALCLTLAEGMVNFSGTWVLDPSRSHIPEGVGMGGGDASDLRATMVIEQQPNTLHIIRTVTAGGQERSETHRYPTDGTPATNTGLRGEVVVTRASWDGDRLSVHSTRTMKLPLGHVSIDSQAIWRLSSDGTTLTIDATVQTPRGEQTLKAVFVKS